MENPSYYAIIPANVRYDKSITPNAKLLYWEITALSNKTGSCRASDSYFAELYGVSKTSIQNWLSSLEKKWYITREVEYQEGTKIILRRYTRIVVYPIQDNLHTPIQDNLRDNNTSINNTKNNKETFIPPLLEEVTNYFEDNWYDTALGKKAYMSYDVAGRHDSKWNKIKNRKQKMINVRFKEENKSKKRQLSTFISEAY